MIVRSTIDLAHNLGLTVLAEARTHDLDAVVAIRNYITDRRAFLRSASLVAGGAVLAGGGSGGSIATPVPNGSGSRRVASCFCLIRRASSAPSAIRSAASPTCSKR